MTPYKLLYPVSTLDGKELLPAGAVISEESLRELILTPGGDSRTLYPLMQHGSIKFDCHEFMSQPPYQIIFADQKNSTAVMNIMEDINVHPAVLESLDYFKSTDFYTYRHTLMVSMLSSLLAQRMMSVSIDAFRAIVTSPSHDQGKICIPLHILKKTKPLTRNERIILEQHAPAGFVLLAYYLRDSRNTSALVARDHHERRDGSGYPLGIFLVDRMIEIVVASDIYDALIMKRPYRKTSYDNRTALEEITELARQGKIDWEVVQALVASNRKNKPHYRDCSVSLEKRGIPPTDNCYGVLAPEDSS